MPSDSLKSVFYRYDCRASGADEGPFVNYKCAADTTGKTVSCAAAGTLCSRERTFDAAMSLMFCTEPLNPPQISEVYDFQDAEEYDAKAQGIHSLQSRVRIGKDIYGSPSSLPPAPTLISRQACGESSPVMSAGCDGKGLGAPILNTEREEPISLTATLLLGNELGRCELPECLFRVRRYNLMIDETRELLVRELRLYLQLPTPNLFRKLAGTWLDGVHGLIL